MSRIAVTLTLVAGLALPGAAPAQSFTGLGIGAGVTSHGLEAEGDFTASPSFASESTRETGLMLDVAYTVATGPDWRLTGGVRSYPVSIETNVFADDRVEIENIGALYGRLGYVIDDTSMVYGVLELGGTELTIRQDGYSPTTEDISTSALGFGYARSLDPGTELFVELLGRAYEEARVSYVGGPIGGQSKDYELTGGNLTLGIVMRF